MIKIEVVVPVHNRKDLTLQCLRSLQNADQTGLDVHIVVVDDGSTDGTSEALHQQFPKVNVIPGDGSLWYTAGTNRGIQAALNRKPDYILAINNDQVFHVQALKRLVLCAQQNRKAIIGALLLDWNRPEVVMATGARWDTWYGGWRHPRDLTAWNVPGHTWEVEIIVGNCVLYPTEVIEQVGLMNESMLPMYGDSEYTPRMQRAGWKLLVEPRAYVWCQPNTSPLSLRSLPVKEMLNVLIFNQKNSYNLITGFRSRWEGAPSHLSGMTAFIIRIFRLALHGLGLGGSWPNWPDNGYFIQENCSLLDPQDFTQALATLDSMLDMASGTMVESRGSLAMGQE